MSPALTDGMNDARYIISESLGECWFQCMHLVMISGASVRDEDVELRELVGVALEVRQPSVEDQVIRTHGDPQVIERTLRKFSKGVIMPDRPFTYGERIFDCGGVDQFEWLVTRLLEKRETKSATICLLVPGEQSNLPCLTTIDAKIRDDALDLQFFYRSQNVVGRQYANFLALAKLQDDLASRCAVAVGRFRGYIASAHIYAFDTDTAQRLLAGEALTISDKYYAEGPRSARLQA